MGRTMKQQRANGELVAVIGGPLASAMVPALAPIGSLA